MLLRREKSLSHLELLFSIDHTIVIRSDMESFSTDASRFNSSMTSPEPRKNAICPKDDSRNFPERGEPYSLPVIKVSEGGIRPPQSSMICPVKQHNRDCLEIFTERNIEDQDKRNRTRKGLFHRTTRPYRTDHEPSIIDSDCICLSSSRTLE